MLTPLTDTLFRLHTLNQYSLARITLPDQGCSVTTLIMSDFAEIGYSCNGTQMMSFIYV